MLFVLGVIIGCSGPAVAQDVIPNIVGTWTGTADQVVQRLDGAGPVFQSGAMTLVVGQQQDRRFHGRIDVVEGPNNLKLGIVGVFTSPTDFRWAEPDGVVSGRFVDPDTIEACYLRVSTFSQIAACETLTRQQ